ncbi:universal stress protein [Prauserella alba]|uniref:Universal stress protein n=1 Tax=Prauserella alba TaxID=176898 RepID=A0ABN1VCK8_9PSEU|nr:universal stress protein [Prauserella alba]MCP2182223.1 Nucleotide-binding universal stress protein, UspA family [Prauserella alba]
MADSDSTRRRKIVVGVDGSAAAEHALRWAVWEASLHGDEIEAIAVREQEDLLPGTSYTFQPYGRRPVADDEGARAYLHTAVNAVTTDVPVVETVRAGDPATELIKASASADMLVVASHHHGRFAEVLLGSTSAECVRHAQCPVVVIPTTLIR